MASKTDVTTSKDSRNVWEQYYWIWTVVFVISLLGPALITANEGEIASGQSTRMWGIVTVLLLTHFAIIGLDRNTNQVRTGAPWVPIGYIATLYAGFIFLVPLNGIFFFLLCGLYNQTFIYLPLKYSAPAAIILSGTTAYLQILTDSGGATITDPSSLFFFLASGIGIALAYWIERIMSQSMQRKRLIEQLEEAQASLAAAERREGVLQERERLAGEIHDTLAQGFTSIITHLEAGEQKWDSDPQASQKHLGQAKEMARHGLNQARRVVQNLRPEILEKSPLPEAIERVVGKWSQQSGITAETAVTGEHHQLHPEAETTIIRAVQEGLHNIEKHANATAVQVTLSYMGNLLMLDVQDNGRGLQSSSNNNGTGYGLTAMRQRVTQVGGTVEIESEPDEGTTLVVQIPIVNLT